MNQYFNCKWCFTQVQQGESRVETERGNHYHKSCFNAAKKRIVVKSPGFGKWLAGAAMAISFALFIAVLFLSENSDFLWR